MEDLKKVYGAPTLDEAEYRPEEFDENGAKYPQITKSESELGRPDNLFQVSGRDQRFIYTTNTVECFHRMLRKYTKTKTTHLTDESVKISISVDTGDHQKWSKPVQNGIIIGS